MHISIDNSVPTTGSPGKPSVLARNSDIVRETHDDRGFGKMTCESLVDDCQPANSSVNVEDDGYSGWSEVVKSGKSPRRKRSPLADAAENEKVSM